MPKRGRALIGPRRAARSAPSTTNAPRAPRKKMILDVLLEYDAQQLVKGYNHDQLSEIHSKVFDLEKELCHALDLDGTIDQVIGAKVEEKVMWFYVKWEDGEHSFVPATILNRIAADKVIQYYEGILQFQPAPQTEAPDGRGVDKLLANSNVLMDTNVNRVLKEQRKKSPPRMEPPTTNNNPAPNNNPADPKRYGQKSFRTMNCTGCNILLQYPEGTKAIKCPVCNTVMHAR